MQLQKILIVDDNVDAADTIALLLQVYGFHVEVAYGGGEALAAAHAYHPYVIFLDIGMPLMDGYEVARALRANTDFSETTLIALTAWGDEESRKKVSAAGFDLHLVKPVEIVEIVRAVNYRRPSP